MKKYNKSGLLVLLGVILVVPVIAQKSLTGLLPLTWEQANMQAARENKLVFVDLVTSGVPANKPGKNPLAEKRVSYFLDRYTVAVRLDAGGDEAKNLVSKWLLNEPPLYAFFMPYGDLLEVVSPADAVTNPQLLTESGERALKCAEVKRNNSRSIHFVDVALAEAVKIAGKENKLIFIEGYADRNRAGMLMEKNIFTLDRVADYYNRNFICLRMNLEENAELAREYGISGFPAYLFLNAEGKKVWAAEGYFPADSFVGLGELAVKKAAGIEFISGNFDEVKIRANKGNKLLFVANIPVSGEVRRAALNIFADPEVAGLFEAKFLNVRKDTAFSRMQFFSADGKLLHQVAEFRSAGDMIRQAERVLQNTGWAGLAAQYEESGRTPEFLEDYLGVLDRADLKEDAARVALEYLSGAGPEKLKEKKYWDLFERYVTDVDSDLFKYVHAHRDEFYVLFGMQTVKRKMNAVWAGGVNRFLIQENGGYRSDEAGLKEYAKRMKKEKAEGWRFIVRDGRMSIAEKAGDWKTFVELAEEKWNEGQIPDAELYGWGVKINEQCRDKAIRFKAARWFALAASDIERKQIQTGKVSVTSYKGFFEKLVDDLVGKD